MKFYSLLYFTFFSIIFIFFDRFSKYLIVKNLKYGKTVYLINNFLKLEKVENRGGIFGLFPDGKIFFIVASFIAIILLLYFLFKINPNKTFIILNLSLIFSGIVGNLIDRLSYGYVIDFISIGNFPVFNLSDSYITIGILLMFIFLWKEDILD